MEGGCACGRVRYRLLRIPMIIHCCHCSWCQRETGSAFVINAVTESDQLQITDEAPDYSLAPSASGKGQEIARCPICHIALWSHYSGAGRRAAFVRVGTMDSPNTFPPEVHIFTSSKQSWVALPKDVPAFAEFYPSSEGLWSKAARMRWKALISSA